MDFKIVALLPAHNEAESIAATVCALRAQTRIPDEIIVICDNCTDATAEIASDHGATVWTTSGNTHKKAGALNFALERVLPQLEDDDAVLVQDADSFLDPDFVAVAAARLDDGYAAVGGNFHARPGGGICGAFQRNEYARYARDNARKHGRVLCITGVGTLFRVSALRAVAAAIADGRLPDSGGGLVYSCATLTEDNWMTQGLEDPAVLGGGIPGMALRPFPSIGPGPRPVGRGLADQQVLVNTQQRGEPMYGKIAGGSGSSVPPCRSPESTSCTRC